MKVYFIQDNSFLRTSRKTNPFFDPIIKVCEENGIEWKLWLPERLQACGYDKGHVEYYRFFNALGIWFWRVAHIFWHAPVWRIYETFGRISRVLFRKTFKADLYVTIAGNLARQLQGMFPNARVIDVQHGVIYSMHNGYFEENGRLVLPYRKPSRREFWLYGRGYADCFFKNHENLKDLERRVKIVGDLLGVARRHEKNEVAIRDAIVVSLQYTNDFGKDVLQSWTDDLTAVFAQVEAVGLQKRYQVLLKHHPRYANSFDISPMMKRFPWLQLTDQSTNDLISHAAYHVTYASTTAFEYAAVGVPTLFTGSEKNGLSKELMYDEYAYPLPMGFETMKKALDDHEEWVWQGESVRAWYRKFYAPFDPSQCLALLRGERVDMI